MSDFSAATPKPNWLYSQTERIGEINDFKAQATNGKANGHKVETTIVKKRPEDAKSASGGADLKGSQAYAPAFGRAALKLHDRRLADIVSTREERLATAPRSRPRSTLKTTSTRL